MHNQQYSFRQNKQHKHLKNNTLHKTNKHSSSFLQKPFGLYCPCLPPDSPLNLQRNNN